MSETVKFDESLDKFQSVVLLLRTREGALYIGNTYFYDGRGFGPDYLTIMYKEPLPGGMAIIDGWNWLDDNSPRVIMVPEQTMETGIEDFMCAHGFEKNWKDINYHTVNNYSDIESYVKKHPIEKDQIVGFAQKRQKVKTIEK